MNTPSRRKASADYHAKLKAEGHRKVTLFLSPEALAALDKLAVGETSRAQAINAAMISAAERLAPERPAKPSETAEGRRASSKPPKTAEKPPKGSGEAVSQTVGRSKAKEAVSAGGPKGKLVGFTPSGEPIYR